VEGINLHARDLTALLLAGSIGVNGCVLLRINCLEDSKSACRAKRKCTKLDCHSEVGKRVRNDLEDLVLVS